MKYYIVYKPDETKNCFLECNTEIDMIQSIQERFSGDLGDSEIFLKII